MVQLSSLLYAVTALIAVEAYALPGGGHWRPGQQQAKAVYFQTNKVPNSIAAIPVSQNGALSGGSLTATGGNGGDTFDATTGKPNGPDSLSSQGSVVVSGNVSLTQLALSSLMANGCDIVSLQCQCRFQFHLHVLHFSSRPYQALPPLYRQHKWGLSNNRRGLG